MSDAPGVIDQQLLDGVTAQAVASPRRRKNHNFHAADDAPCHRLLNAIEPGSYVAPHRHADKDETILVVRGRLGALLFDAEGKVTTTAVLTPGGETIGVNLAAGTFHSLVSLEPGTVFFESKAGPYRPLTPAERASWAPIEGDPEVADTLKAYEAHFA